MSNEKLVVFGIVSFLMAIISAIGGGGACYPFGNIADLRTIVDKSLAEQEIISCNPGRHDISLKFRFNAYKKLVKPEIVEVTIGTPVTPIS